LSEDNMLAKNIPGVSQLFKFGQNLVNQTLPGLDENVSRVIKEFIGKNMDNVSKYAETVLIGEMDEKLIRELANGFWDDMKTRRVSQLATDLGQLQNEQVLDALDATWRQLRTTPLFEKIVRSLVDSFIKHYGDTEIRGALETVGVGREKIVMRITEAVTPAIERGVQSGKLAEIIKKRLGAFYLSSQASAILKG